MSKRRQLLKKQKKKRLNKSSGSTGGGNIRSIQLARATFLTQRATTLPVSRLTDSDIESYKSEMEKVINYTNNKIRALHDKGLDTVELHRFQGDDPEKYFELPHTDNLNEIRAYMTQVRLVLTSIDDSSNTPLLETAMMEAAWYRGQFGNQYPGKRYNVHDVIDESGNIIRRGINEDIASKAFEAYRNLESEYAPIIGRKGQEGVYGSENLIIAIYDYYERGMDGQLYGKKLLEAWQDEFMKEMEGVNWSLDEASSIITKWDDFVSTRWF